MNKLAKISHAFLIAGLMVPATAALADPSYPGTQPYWPSNPSTNSCDWPLQAYSSPGADQDYIRSHHPECFSGSRGSVAQGIISATSVQQIQNISNVVANRFTSRAPAGVSPVALANQRGMAAGNEGKWFAWSSYNSIDNKYHNNPTNIRNESDVGNLNLGADYMLAPNMVLGLSLGFDKGDSESRSNNAVATYDTKGYTIAPYFGWQILPNLTLDATLGFGKGDMDQDRNISSDSDRSFGAANLTYTQWYGNLQVSAKGGYLYATEKYKNMSVSGNKIGGTSHTNRLGQVRLGAQVGYWVTGGVMPYVGLTYTNDVERTKLASEPWDRDALLMTVGVNAVSLKDGLTVGVVYNQEVERKRTDSDSLMVNVNLRF